MAVKIEICKQSLTTRLVSLSDWEISSEDRKALVRFLAELQLGKINKGRKITERRCVKYLDVLRTPLEFFGKSTSKLTLKDIESFEKHLSSGQLLSDRKTPYADATKVDIRRGLRVYLRWKLGSAKATKLTDWLDTRDVWKTPDFLKETDVEKLYKACKSPEERYVIAILFDAGARASEFHNIRFEDIDLPEESRNHVRLTLKEEYSKTKGRTISLYWKHTLEAVREFLALRRLNGTRSDEPVFTRSYTAVRLFLRRLGKKVLGRSVHYHLFRHSSATYYADKMNRQQLCIRYGWTFSSNMPDIYIARAGVDMKELDEKFTSTTIEELKRKLERKEEEDRIKGDRIKLLESEVGTVREDFRLLVKLLSQKPTLEEIEVALERKRAA
jgi:integrase